MRFHYVYLFCSVLKIDGFSVFVAAGFGLLVLVGMLRGALLRVLSFDFSLF